MRKLKIIPIKHSTMPRTLFTGLLLLLVSAVCQAELQELEDEKLDELRGKEGITIDLAFKLSIGEIAIDFNEREFDDEARPKALTPPPPRIEYHQNGN